MEVSVLSSEPTMYLLQWLHAIPHLNAHMSGLKEDMSHMKKLRNGYKWQRI